MHILNKSRALGQNETAVACHPTSSSIGSAIYSVPYTDQDLSTDSVIVVYPPCVLHFSFYVAPRPWSDALSFQYVLPCSWKDKTSLTSRIYCFISAVPSVPRSFRVMNRHYDTIYLEWETPAEPNGLLTGYILKYQTCKRYLNTVH